MGWVVIATPQPLCPGRDPVLIVQEAGWAPRPVCKGADNLTPHPHHCDSISTPSSFYRVAILTALSRSTDVLIQRTGTILAVLLKAFMLKVAVKVKIKFTQEQTTKAQMGSRGITLLFF
jgi:hypothetical protein